MSTMPPPLRPHSPPSQQHSLAHRPPPPSPEDDEGSSSGSGSGGRNPHHHLHQQQHHYHHHPSYFPPTPPYSYYLPPPRTEYGHYPPPLPPRRPLHLQPPLQWPPMRSLYDTPLYGRRELELAAYEPTGYDGDKFEGDAHEDLAAIVARAGGALSSVSLSIASLHQLCEGHRTVMGELEHCGRVIEEQEAQLKELVGKEKQLEQPKEGTEQPAGIQRAEVNALRNKIDALELEARGLREVVEEKEKERREGEAVGQRERGETVAEFEQWKREALAVHEQAMGQKQQTHELLMKERDGAHSASLKEMAETHSSAAEERDTAHQLSLKKLQEEYEHQKEKLTDIHGQKIVNLGEMHEESLKKLDTELRLQFAGEKQGREAAWNSEKQALENERAAMQISFSEEKKAINVQFAAEKENIEATFGQKINDILKNFEATKDCWAEEKARWGVEKARMVIERSELESLKERIYSLESIKINLEEERRGFVAKDVEFADERERLNGIIENLQSTVDNMQCENRILTDTLQKVAGEESGEIRSRGDGFYIDAFSKLTRDIIEISQQFTVPPVAYSNCIPTGLPAGLPSILGNTEASKLLCQAYVQHIISTHLCYRIFQPFLFSLGKRYDKTDTFFQAMSTQLREKSTRKEAVWRQYTLLAGYTALGAKKNAQLAAASVKDEIAGHVKPFIDPEKFDVIVLGITRIVKYAVETWRYARMEREMISASMRVDGTAADLWASHRYDGQLPPYVSDIAASHTPIIPLLPLFYREGMLPSLLRPSAALDSGCVFAKGIALYEDCLPVLHKSYELGQEPIEEQEQGQPGKDEMHGEELLTMEGKVQELEEQKQEELQESEAVPIETKEELAQIVALAGVRTETAEAFSIIECQARFDLEPAMDGNLALKQPVSEEDCLGQGIPDEDAAAAAETATEAAVDENLAVQSVAGGVDIDVDEKGGGGESADEETVAGMWEESEGGVRGKVEDAKVDDKVDKGENEDEKKAEGTTIIEKAEGDKAKENASEDKPQKKADETLQAQPKGELAPPAGPEADDKEGDENATESIPSADAVAIQDEVVHGNGKDEENDDGENHEVVPSTPWSLSPPVQDETNIDSPPAPPPARKNKLSCSIPVPVSTITTLATTTSVPPTQSFTSSTFSSEAKRKKRRKISTAAAPTGTRGPA